MSTPARARCAICGGELYREDHDSPPRHVDLGLWAISPHDAVEAEPVGGQSEPEP